jgi:hypothetical protein
VNPLPGDPGKIDTIYYHGLSLQSEDLPLQLRHYSAVVFPIFLDEKYGPNMIRHIWKRAAEMGRGTHWTEAVNHGVDSATSGQDSLGHALVQALLEFNTWTYFTGPFREFAPNNEGFSEGAAYPVLPVETQMFVRRQYPDTSRFNDPRFDREKLTYNPQMNGAMYMRLEEVSSVLPSIRYDVDTTIDSTCIDSIQNPPDTNWQCTLYQEDTVVDSTLLPDTAFEVFFYVSTAPEAWGVRAILELKNEPDSHEVRDTVIFDTTSLYYQLPEPERYETVTFLLCPTATNAGAFSEIAYMPVSIFLLDSNIIAGPDSAFIARTPSLLYPYPNPIMLTGGGKHAADSIIFRFELPTDSMANLEFLRPLYQLDLYTVAGERVRTVQRVVDGEPTDRDTGPPVIQYEVGWDLLNDGGEKVASGVYLAYVHLYSSNNRANLLAEDRTKVVLIR